MALSAGDPVHVPGIGTGVVREVRRGGRYVVLVKNTTMVVTEAQIAPAEPQKRRRRPARAAVPEPTGVEPLSRQRTPASIDLHGLTVAEAEAALDSCLNDAVLGGVREVRVIHGRSGGRLRAAVHGRLRRYPAVRAFRVDPLNPGVTLVEL